MEYKVVTYFTDKNYRKFEVGSIVTIKYPNGGGLGGCEILKITNTGFHFKQGTSRAKSVQFKDISEVL